MGRFELVDVAREVVAVGSVGTRVRSVRRNGADGVARNDHMRQLWDGKVSAEIEGFDPPMLAVYGELCGWTLARAHARSGDRLAIAAYLGATDAFEEAVADFAEGYAAQNDEDYRTFLAATTRA